MTNKARVSPHQDVPITAALSFRVATRSLSSPERPPIFADDSLVRSRRVVVEGRRKKLKLWDNPNGEPEQEHSGPPATQESYGRLLEPEPPTEPPNQASLETAPIDTETIWRDEWPNIPDPDV